MDLGWGLMVDWRVVDGRKDLDVKVVEFEEIETLANSIANPTTTLDQIIVTIRWRTHR